MRRVYTASDVRRYVRCPRQWWYEEHDRLAALSPDELRRRMSALRRRYGERAERQSDYAVLAALLRRASLLARGRDVHRAHAASARRAGAGCAIVLLPLAIAVIVALFAGIYG